MSLSPVAGGSMANPKQKLEKMLKESGAALIRTGKHPVYLLPNGHKFTGDKSPSDRRAVYNHISTLKRQLAKKSGEI